MWKTAAFIFISIITALSVATYARNAVWTDEVRLWEDVISKSPLKSRTHSNLGTALHERAQYGEAIEHLSRSLELDTGSMDVHKTYANRGAAYYETGQYDKAMKDFNKAIYLSPFFDEAFYYRGKTYLKKMRFAPAIADFRQACVMGHSTACFKLKTLTDTQGK
jgi:tetratricopeptide (TPR) repeat protein